MSFMPVFDEEEASQWVEDARAEFDRVDNLHDELRWAMHPLTEEQKYQGDWLAKAIYTEMRPSNILRLLNLKFSEDRGTP